MSKFVYCSIGCEALTRTEKCKNCKSRFQLKTTTQIFCKPECQKVYRKLNPVKKLDKRCEYCGTVFLSSSLRARFCKTNCQQMNYYKSKKVRLLPNKLEALSSGSDKFSKRWELLWTRRPDLHKEMIKIEAEIPIYE